VSLSPATGKTFTVTSVADTNNAYTNALCTIAARTGITLPTGVTAGTTTVALDATGLGTCAAAATSPVAGQGYTISFGGTTFTVTYRSPVATRVALSGTNTAITVANGGTTGITGKVYDQYQDAVADAIVSFTGGGAGRNTASSTLLSSVTTGADGKASYSLTDAYPTAAATTDTVQISAVSAGTGVLYPNRTNAADGSAATNVTVTYAASVTPATVTLTAKAKTAPTLVTTGLFTTLAPGLAIDGCADYEAVLKSSTGGVLPDGVAVTFTIKGGYTTSTTLTKYTGNVTAGAGKATLTVCGKTTGALTVTASSGGVTATDSTVTVYNSSTTDARTVALDAATYAVTGGQIKRVTATVKDRWGNPVSGVLVSFAFTSGVGRFAGGGLTATATTATDGTAVTDLAPLTVESGAGAFKATITATDATDETVVGSELLGDGLTARGAAVVKATAAVTVTAGAAATATTDAATTSKINDIATAVANLSTTVAGLVASLVAQIKDTKAAIADTKAALDKLAAVVAKIQKKVKA